MPNTTAHCAFLLQSLSALHGCAATAKARKGFALESEFEKILFGPCTLLL
jgi:hypothetical protein